MAILQAVVELIGAPPADYDIVVWVMLCFVLLFLLSNTFAILGALFRFLRGG